MRLPLLTLVAAIPLALCQSSQNASSSLTPQVVNITSTFTSTSGSLTSVFTSVIPTTIDPTASSTSSTTSSPNPTQSASTGPAIPTLATIIDPGFGVLGALLILTGLPSAFLGHKNRWTSFFLIGCYTLSLVCFVLILKFGVIDSINPPNKKLRGIFVFACSVVGIAGGGVAIFFWRQTRFVIGAWGGFVLALWIECLRNGGVIRQLGFKWIFYIGLSVMGFILCIIPRFHYHVLLLSTAAVGATATVLGIDCFTTANLKEFYVWNLGFDDVFPKYTERGINFPVSQVMAIELGLIAALTLMGTAVQLNVLKQLQLKLREIRSEQKKRNEQLEADASARFATLTAKEMAEWEKEHGRADSQISGLPLLKRNGNQSPIDETSTAVGEYRRRPSGTSDFKTLTPEDDERRRSVALPALDVGGNLEAGLTKEFLSDMEPSSVIDEDLKKKEELLSEIAEIRKSIEQLRSASPGSSSTPHSRRPSFSSRRTLSLGFAEALDVQPARPPRATNPRGRIHSMELSRYVDSTTGTAINRPSSVPLQEDFDWNEYVRERKLLQPPSGISAPIPTSPIVPIAPQPRRASLPVPAAVTEALHRRQLQEASLGVGEWGTRVPQHEQSALHELSEDVPLSRLVKATRGTFPGPVPSSVGPQKAQVVILPPRKLGFAQAPTTPQESQTRVRTFEELEERHREKIRNLQAPLTQAEAEQANLAEARRRWESSMKHERVVMSQRESEKATAARQRYEEKKERNKVAADTAKHRPSLSADLGKLPGASSSTSKRQSMMKVEDWRKFQEEVENTANVSTPPKRNPSVPFPPSKSLRESGRRHSTFK